MDMDETRAAGFAAGMLAQQRGASYTWAAEHAAWMSGYQRGFIWAAEHMAPAEWECPPADDDMAATVSDLIESHRGINS